VQRVSQLISKSPVDTETFNKLSPLHKEVVSDFYDNLDYECNDVVKEIETTIDKVSIKHNVETDVIYNYIEKETGA
jgi:gas vesicle protein